MLTHVAPLSAKLMFSTLRTVHTSDDDECSGTNSCHLSANLHRHAWLLCMWLLLQFYKYQCAKLHMYVCMYVCTFVFRPIHC